ncbi:MAG: hypothetical protein COV67_15095 [Nitrospinae bacterium CG11_big_fil_rev_8_21_14_0_20_56_8]|nr:MAG: hypothetical protein COV67_15095 [Nitrospinae bacterium CG11_big_fil_rev_8_21_14_0_20_56_8]
MKEILAKPGFLTAGGTVGADISYLLALIFTGMYLFSWWLAKKAEGTRHHKLIFASMVAMIVYFVAYYYARQLGVLALEGKEGFGGPPSVYESVFLPILRVHLTLVTLGLVLAPYMIIEGVRATEIVEGKHVLKEGNLQIRSKTFRTILLTLLGLWGANQLFILLFRGASTGKSIAWALIFATIALVVSLEKGIEKLWPDGARRHRMLGRGTMVIYALTLVSSTLTYLMLYVIFPKQ